MVKRDLLFPFGSGDRIGLFGTSFYGLVVKSVFAGEIGRVYSILQLVLRKLALPDALLLPGCGIRELDPKYVKSL